LNYELWISEFSGLFILIFVLGRNGPGPNGERWERVRAAPVARSGWGMKSGWRNWDKVFTRAIEIYSNR